VTVQTRAEPGVVVIGQRSPGEPQTMAIIADRRLSLAALCALLLNDSAYRFVAEARGGAAVQELLATLKPSILVVDDSGGSFSAIDPSDWNGRVLLLLDPEDDPAVFAQAVRARPFGYVARSAPRSTLDEAVLALQRSEPYLDPRLLAKVLHAMRSADSNGSPPAELSQRERSILVRIASGQSTKEIARAYAIAPKTVSNHVNNMEKKLHVRHRGQLVLYAAQQGMTII